MFSRIVMLCAGIALLSNNAMGQAGQPVTRDEFNQLVQSVRELAADAKANKEDTKTQLAALRAEVASVTDIQSEDRAQLAQLAKKDKNGRSYLRIDASHEPTRIELQHAIKQTMPSYGTVIFVNKMGHDQTFSVNGTTHTVIADSRLPVTVPVGAFQVRLPNQQPVTRYILPNLDAQIVIRPQEIASNAIHWITDPVYYVYQ